MANKQLLINEALLTVIVGTFERFITSMCCYWKDSELGKMIRK